MWSSSVLSAVVRVPKNLLRGLRIRGEIKGLGAVSRVARSILYESSNLCTVKDDDITRVRKIYQVSYGHVFTR